MKAKPNCPACQGTGLYTLKVYKNGIEEKEICPVCLCEDLIMLEGRVKWRHALKKTVAMARLTWDEVRELVPLEEMRRTSWTKKRTRSMA